MITRDYSEGIEIDEIIQADIGLAMLLLVVTSFKAYRCNRIDRLI